MKAMVANSGERDCSPMGIGQGYQCHFKSHCRNIDLEAILTIDEASKNNPKSTGTGGCLLIPRKDIVHLFAYGLGRLTNNAVEYATTIRGLKLSRGMGIKSLLLQGDSILVLNQISKTWVKVVCHLEDPFNEAQNLIRAFDHLTFKHTPHTNNLIADYLANIKTILPIGMDTCNTMMASIISQPSLTLWALRGRHSPQNYNTCKLSAQASLMANQPTSHRSTIGREDAQHEPKDPSTYQGKQNLHCLAREISDNTTTRLSVVEVALLEVGNKMANLKDAVQSASSASIHMMHKLLHLNTRGVYIEN
eukprot:Gb_28697 [translate_table: standard]